MRTRTAELAAQSLGIASALLIAAGALAQHKPPEEESERPDQPPAPWTPPVYGPSAPCAWGPGFPFSSQVNVGPGGQNIVGDAANEPSLAVDPTARLRIVVGWRQFDSVTSNFRQAGYSVSRDGGRTWTAVNTFTPGIFRSDPVVRAGPDGTIYYYSLTVDAAYHCDIFRSRDGGTTWTGPLPAAGGDKAWITVDDTDGPGRDNLYAVWSSYASCCAGEFSRSDDQADSFLTPSVHGLPHFGTAAVGVDGSFYAAGVDNSTRISRSSDAPTSPTPTFDLARNSLLGSEPNKSPDPNPAGLDGQAWVDVDKSGGARHGWLLLLNSVNPGTADPSDVRITHSADRGQTWTAAVKVASETPGANAWQWCGTLGVAPSGRLDVVYNDTQGTGAANLSVTRYTSSNDGGATWATPIPLGPVWDSYVGWPQQNKIGDYYDIASDRTGCYVAYAATYNNEQDVYCVRIGPYDCNDNGTDDAQDISAGTSRDRNHNGIPDECEIAAGTLCPADIDGNGFVNGDDFDTFSTAFVDGDPGADFDGNGFVNGDDYDFFAAAFEAGC